MHYYKSVSTILIRMRNRGLMSFLLMGRGCQKREGKHRQEK